MDARPQNRIALGDKRFIFSAASQAQQAADYLHGLQPKAKETFVEKEDERRHNKPAPDAVLRAMEDETGPLPDAVAAAWNDDEEKPEFTKREDDRRAKRSGREVA